MEDLDLKGFERYCKNIGFYKSIGSYKGYLSKGYEILKMISNNSIQEYVLQKEQNSEYLKIEFQRIIQEQKLHSDLYNDFSSSAKKYKDFLDKKYPKTKDEILAKYDEIYQYISRNGLMKLKNVHNTQFTLEINSVSLCARGADGKGQELMSIAKDEILNVLFQDKPYTYPTYEPSVINLLFDIIESENTPKNINKNEDDQPLNQILYGPPGTGKTYNTINKALEIIDGIIPDQREDAKKRFDELVQAKQIEFVTFHQSYGYEEFVEGIKAIPVGKEGNEDGSEMIYKPMAGVFKKLSKLAKEEFSKVQSTTQSIVKKYKLEAKSLNIQAEMIEDNANNFRVLKGSKIRKGQAPSFDQYTYGELKKKVLQQAKLKEQDEFYILEDDYTFQSMSAASSIVLGRQSNGFTDWKEISNDQDLFVLSTKTEDLKNYVLIIDEINRGNISKIFGELITLIEPSKRIGANEALYVKLPYSGESFGIPSNLYIIGTMNTADRSIALMDTALRRRFEFTEMMPDTKELEGIEIDGINIAQLLDTINKRIEYLYDRDQTI
jgi:5-methylcytosine-specific restriction protein B